MKLDGHLRLEKKIDELDIEIVRLINQRAATARAIGELKDGQSSSV
jgi:chorismate mutase